MDMINRKITTLLAVAGTLTATFVDARFCWSCVPLWCSIFQKEERHVSSVSLPTSSVSPQRVREIAALLPDVPQGIGHTYKDRDYWDKMRKDTAAVALLKKAPELPWRFCPAKKNGLIS